MVSKVYKQIAMRIAVCRAEKGLSQDALADLLGVSAAEIEDIESGSSRIGAACLFKIAKALNVPLGMLFASTSPPEADLRIAAGFAESSAGYADATEIVRLVAAFDLISQVDSRKSVIDLAEALARTEMH